VDRSDEQREALRRVESVAGELLGPVMQLGVGLDSILAAAKDSDEPTVEVDPVELAMLDKAAGVPDPLETRVRAFLLRRFTGIRDDLAEQLRQDELRNPEEAAKELANYGVLIGAITGREGFPEDEEVVEFVAEIMKQNDEATSYREVAFEHWAYASLIQRISGASGVPGKPTG
jgi:hypothetical protein